MSEIEKIHPIVRIIAPHEIRRELAEELVDAHSKWWMVNIKHLGILSIPVVWNQETVSLTLILLTHLKSETIRLLNEVDTITT